MLARHKRQASSRSSALDTVDARKAIEKVRRLEKGYRPSPSGFKISLQEYRTLLRLIEGLSEGDPLKGFWADKFRYDYDSETEIFEILMLGSTHQGFLAAIDKQITEYLTRTRSSDIAVVQEFAKAIKERRSTDCEYAKKKDPDYKPSDSSDFKESSVATEPNRRTANQSHPQEASTQRRSPRLNELSLQSAGPQPDTHNQLSEQATPSPVSDSSDIEKLLSPDCSWGFTSSEIEDDNAAFIVEVASTQDQKKLETKVDNYFKFCNATAVLACRIGDQFKEGPSIELLVRRSDAQGQYEKYVRRWRVPLDGSGHVPVPVGTDQRARIKLYDFISRDSGFRYYSQRDSNNVCGTYEPLCIDIESLRAELIQLRRKEAKKEERRTRKRQRTSEELADDSPMPESKRRLLQLMESD